ncbi:hypothetical protein Nepgr_033535 [Nepenthes gracilis]|uniref:Uncharacterized protein n=1 Tax=Nepenthes gracilis TaxID=150966 RepID=A0AAD3TM41_NEPGR|nr:hypothetical protein Nepgr_033535 [Nepenthes gracilis]
MCQEKYPIGFMKNPRESATSSQNSIGNGQVINQPHKEPPKSNIGQKSDGNINSQKGNQIPIRQRNSTPDTADLGSASLYLPPKIQFHAKEERMRKRRRSTPFHQNSKDGADGLGAGALGKMPCHATVRWRCCVSNYA